MIQTLASPALSDLDAIADYMALEYPVAAKKLVRSIFKLVEQFAEYPKCGTKPAELNDWNNRQIVEPPSRVFYRLDDVRVFLPMEK